MKRKIYRLAGLLLVGFIVASCSNPEKMKDTADQVTASCKPARLEVQADVIKATISVLFPEKYFHPDAVLEMLPVLKHGGSETEGEVKIVQGEGVKDNNTVIPKQGGSYAQDVTFTYTDAMRVATLEIRPTLVLKGRRIPFPQDIKVADGVIATYKLAEIEVKPAFHEDVYQGVKKDSKDAEIKFLINQAAVRPAELNKDDIKLLKQFIVDALKDDKATLKRLQISSYASPDGPTDKNDQLSVNRGKASDDMLSSQFKKSKISIDKSLISIEHTAEDWAGFQELMKTSDIQDKELILRVLSMYSDPEVREREIKNIAAVYLVIADKILPQLRRSKLQASIEVANLNDSDIKAFVDAGNLDTLDVEQLIRAGNLLYGSNDVKITLFKKAAEKFKDYRAYNNLGAIYLWQNKLEEADKALTEAGNLNTAGDAKIKNNTGYLQLLNGNTDQAGKLLASAGVDESKAGLGYLAIQKGDYSQAATFLKGVKSFNEALVQVLNGQTNNAITVLSNLTSAKAYYLKAVLGARNNVEADVVNNLKKAFELDASLKNVAQSDIDFAAFQPKIQY